MLWSPRLLLMLAVLQALPFMPSRAQTPAPGRNVPVETGVANAPVILGADTLFFLHAQFGAFTARERADAVSQRLAILAQTIGSETDSIVVVDVDRRTELAVGQQVLMTVLDADAGTTVGARLATARRYASTITARSKTFVQSHSTRAYLRGAAYTTIVVALLLLILAGMAWLFRRIYDRIAHESLPIPSLRIQRLELLSAKSIATMLISLARLLRTLFTLLLFYTALSLVLSFFPSTAGYATKIVGYAIAPVAQAVSALVAYLPDAFAIVVIIVIARYLIKLLHSIFIALGNGTITVQGFYRDWATPTYKLTRTLVIVFAAVVIFPHLPGSSSDAFKGISVFLGILVSLGSSGAVSNMIAGVVLTYTRAFQIGDRVQIGETVGDVTQRTLLVTRVVTIKNVEVTIPNSSVLSSHALNFSRMADGHGVILHTKITIGYDAPWRRVHELLLAAADATEGARKSPAPFVLQTSLDDSYVTYELNLYTDKPASMARIYADVHQHIQDAFNEGGVEIMSPHYAAHRDGNHTTVPEIYLAQSYRAPAFRVERSRDAGDTN
ncbi:MAG: mechanosensitive ion channel family protein [Gemmatimonadaceae bacterium]